MTINTSDKLQNEISTLSQSESNLIVHICINIVMPSAVAIGLIGNLLSILVFSRREMIKFCVSIFMIVLAMSDILLLITSLFNMIWPKIFATYLSDKSRFWCHFHGYFDLLFAAVSGYSVVFISLERWFSIWKPFDKGKYVTFKTTLITVVSYIFVSVIFFSWFPLTMDLVRTENMSNESCNLIRPTIYKILGTISVIFAYLVPFVFLGILNILIVYRLHARQNTSIQRSTFSSMSSNSYESASTRKRHQRQRNLDRHITVMLITVAIAFMVMSFPYQIYWIYMQIRQLTEPNETCYTLTQTFRYLNCCCNFFLYSATSSLFRRELGEIFQCSSSKTNRQTNSLTRSKRTNSPKTETKQNLLVTFNPVTSIGESTIERNPTNSIKDEFRSCKN